MEDLVKDFPHLTACDMESVVLVDSEETATEFILPKFPSIFYIAYLTGMVDDKLLSVDHSNVPTTTCGDGCAVNTKGVRLLDEAYGPLFKVFITSVEWHYVAFVHLCLSQSTRCSQSLQESQSITQAFCS